MQIVVNQDKIRIDKYLSNVTEYSRSLIQKMIDGGYILVNNNNIKVKHLLQYGDIIIIKDGFIKESHLEPEKIKLDIVYEDQDLIVINKPSGMVVHPGNGNKTGTLVNALLHHTNKLSNKESDIRPGIVHRIDKDTSGLLLIAKNDHVHELLATEFKNKTIIREYIALLIGELKTDTATIDAPIGRDVHDRMKMNVTNVNAKKAVTHLTVLNRYQGYTLVNFKLETGRTHQIRVHAKYIGYPVYNDPVYTKNKCTSFGQFLHSSKLEFIHPITKKHLIFECSLPKEFNDFLFNLETK
ncbi:MAG: RluA family pseudouridine synthase [Bacilli bacterium]|nr:RluA family pseudouridine synthase [Bacilli bacterium]